MVESEGKLKPDYGFFKRSNFFYNFRTQRIRKNSKFINLIKRRNGRKNEIRCRKTKINNS